MVNLKEKIKEILENNVYARSNSKKVNVSGVESTTDKLAELFSAESERVKELEKALSDIFTFEDYLDIEPFEPVYDAFQRAKKLLEK